MEKATPHELLGGERVLFQLVERCDALKVSEAEIHGVRRLHPEDHCGSHNKADDSPGQP